MWRLMSMNLACLAVLSTAAVASTSPEIVSLKEQAGDEACSEDSSSHLSLLQMHARSKLTAETSGTTFDAVAADDEGLQVNFYYYDGYVKNLGEVDFSAEPSLTRVDAGINYPDTDAFWAALDVKDKFAAKWTGTLHIKRAGTYTFALTSDDGSSLVVDDDQLIDNDGLHSMLKLTGQVELSKGEHKIEVTYFENTGSAGCILAYSGPDNGNVLAVIQASALTPPEEEPVFLAPPAEDCPAECRAPKCRDGDFASGGWLLDDGVCTAACSAPNAKGKRQCGRGAAFENSADSIDCSGCLKPEEQCGQCVLWGDPHIVPFDREVLMRNGRGSSVNLYDYGDYWIVKSRSVYIQGRYWSSKFGGGQSMTRGLAISGPFIEGNRLMIEPLDGTVTWNGDEIASNFPSTFEAKGLLYLKYHDRAEVVRTGGSHPGVKGLDIWLPLGVKLTVNRLSQHLDILITMHQVPGGIDGHCGNCNQDPNDDTTQKISDRYGDPVPPAEDLFETKEYSYLGCYKDVANDRDLPVAKDVNMNDEECAMACMDYKWFGIQGNGACYCGNEYGKHGEAEGCKCPPEESGPVGDGMQCIFAYFDSIEPPDVTIDDCEPDLLKKAKKICKASFKSAEVNDREMYELCLSDVCFGGEEFADEDAWAGHEVLPCATVADVQRVCGLDEGDCSQGGANCNVAGCAAYTGLGWFSREIKLLRDGQALGDGTLNNVVQMELRDGICITDMDTLEVCTTGQCLRTEAFLSGTTTTTTECKGKDCVIWGDPHVHSFDSMKFSDTRAGDMWLLKSHEVFIQGRFGHSKHSEASFLKAVAIGGPFLNGNTLLVEAGEGQVLWNEQSILHKSNATFKMALGGKAHVKAVARNQMPNVAHPDRYAHGMDISLPHGISVTMNRFQTWLGLRIVQEHTLVGGQDGVCGNYNNNTQDDSLKALTSRMQLRVGTQESLFRKAPLK